MKENNLYIYDQNNLLLNPQKYQFSTFSGIEFLLEYEEARIQKINFLKNRICIYTLEEIFQKLANKIQDISISELGSKESENILSKILLQLFKKKDTQQTNKIISAFIKKFEIKKRLYSSYDEDFNENTDDYSNLRNYILLTSICLFKYEETKNLKYLNTCLKINDTICSQIKTINDQLEKSLMIYILTLEIKKIKELCNTKRILFK